MLLNGEDDEPHGGEGVWLSLLPLGYDGRGYVFNPNCELEPLGSLHVVLLY